MERNRSERNISYIFVETERNDFKRNGTERNIFDIFVETERKEFIRKVTERDGMKHNWYFTGTERNEFLPNGIKRNGKNRILKLLKRNGTEWIGFEKLRISFVPFCSIPIRSVPESKNVAGICPTTPSTIRHWKLCFVGGSKFQYANNPRFDTHSTTGTPR